MVEAVGFKVAYHNTFEGTSSVFHEESYQEEEYIFYREDGYVMYAESYCGGTSSSKIYTAKLYYEASRHHKEGIGRLIPCEGKLKMWNDDVRENFLRQLGYIPLLKTVNPVWTSKNPFLWFVNYMEKRAEGNDYKEINKRKIEASVPELRKIIYGE